MARGPDAEYLLGKVENPLGFAGTVGFDRFYDHPISIPGIKDSEKKLVPFEKIEEIIDANNIVFDREDVGNSTAITAMAYSKLVGEQDGGVLFYAVLAPHDPTTTIIRGAMEDEGIELRETPFRGRGAKNPVSLILPPLQDRTVVSGKRLDSPPLLFHHAGSVPDTLVFGPQSGDRWEEGFHKGMDFADGHGIRSVVLASEPLIRQAVHDAQKKQAMQRLLRRSNGFFGNPLDLAASLAVLDIESETAPLYRQALRLQQSSEDPRSYTRITNAGQGAFAVGPDQIIYRLQIPKVPNIGRWRKINTLGGGDASAATGLYILRSEGVNPNAIKKSLIKGGQAGTSVLRKPDALSGQLHHDQLHRRARGYGIETYRATRRGLVPA